VDKRIDRTPTPAQGRCAVNGLANPKTAAAMERGAPSVLTAAHRHCTWAGYSPKTARSYCAAVEKLRLISW